MNTIKNRSELLFLYDIRDANPNGDPLDSNKPRMDEETSINLVTDVRLKRTIRDYLFEYGKTEDIFVRDVITKEGKLQDGKTRATNFGKTKEEIYNNVLEKCVDVRLFGATIPLQNDSITLTGPVQFTMGRSLHKTSIEFIKGTGAFASREERTQKTFREEYVVPYSLIGFYGIINENAAKHTNLTEDDVALLIEGMWEGTKNLISRSKAGQTPRLLMKIEYKVNGYHIGDLLTSLKLRLKCDDEFSIRSTEDYAIDITDLKSILMQNKDKIKRIGIRYDSRLKFVEAQREDTIESIFSGFPIAII
jgi:CRISPR-associated protein Csh2